MKTDDHKDELIEKYLLGDLQGTPLQNFKQRLALDESLRREVALEGAILRNLRTAGRQEWMQKLESFHQDLPVEEETEESLEQRLTPVRQIDWFRKSYFWLAASVSLVLVSSVAIWQFNDAPQTPQELYVAYYQPYQSLHQSTRGADTQATQEKAFQAYNQQRYAESIQLFREVLAQQADEEVLYHLGVAYLAADQAGEATQTLERYLRQYQEFAFEAKWYLGLSYLKQGKVPDAKRLFTQLAGDGSSANPYQQPAQDLLADL